MKLKHIYHCAHCNKECSSTDVRRKYCSRKCSRADASEKKKEYNQQYFQRPDVKAKQKEYNQRPDVKEKKKEYNQRRECHWFQNRERRDDWRFFE